MQRHGGEIRGALLLNVLRFQTLAEASESPLTTDAKLKWKGQQPNENVQHTIRCPKHGL
jgi:hypothetical protein